MNGNRYELWGTEKGFLINEISYMGCNWSCYLGYNKGLQSGNLQQFTKNISNKLNLQNTQQMMHPLQQMAQPMQQMTQPLQQINQLQQQTTQSSQQMKQPLPCHLSSSES